MFREFHADKKYRLVTVRLTVSCKSTVYHYNYAVLLAAVSQFARNIKVANVIVLDSEFTLPKA